METLTPYPNLICPSSFLSYLWGMETTSTEDSEYDIFTLFILPMRNGNARLNLNFNCK